MDTPEKNWKLQTLPFDENIHQALQQQHHAAQFIALAGRHLIPQQPDDSNTNMQYIPDEGFLLGNSLPNGLRMALHLTDLTISILDQKNNVKKVISLEGKTKQEVFDEIKQSLSDLGVEVADFKNELHYEMPAHQLDKGSDFSVKEKRYFIENTIYRNNAEIVISEIAKAFEKAEPVRIWPHHFDTGSFFPLSHNNKGELTQSIGIGWAMPDSMITEPYYYLSFWSEKPLANLTKLTRLDAGKWMLPDWNGAVLKHSEIFEEKSAEKQYKLVESFFKSGIDILIDYLSD